MRWRQAVLFCVVLVLLWVGLDQLLLLGLRRIDTGTFGVWHKAMQGRINAQVVICGSSRAREHYDPQLIGPALGMTAFNLGRDGTLPDLQLPFLLAYLRHNKKPELIIQNLDLTSLSFSKDIYIPGQYLPYLDQEEIYRALHAIKPGIWREKYIPLYGFNADDMRFTPVPAMFGLLGISPPEDQPYGFLAMHRGWNRDFDRFRAAHPDGTESSYHPQAISVLTQLVDLCREKDIKLVFVYSPEWHENYEMILNREKLFSEFKALADRNRILFLDYSNTPVTRDKQNFYNSQHLNARGSRLFSEDLAQKLKAAGYGVE